MKKLKASIWPKILLLVILFGLLVWFGYTIKKNQSLNEITETQNNVVVETDQETVQENQSFFGEKKTENLEGNGYEMVINYPQINNEEVNNIVLEFIEAEKAQIRSTVDMTEQDYITENYSLQIDYEISQNKANNSLVFSVYNYTGGAHGNFYFKTFTFDDSGKLKSLTDIVPNQKLPALSDLIVEKLTQTLPSDYLENGGLDWVKEGVNPDTESLANFSVSESGITFYFPPYQVGPWALGSQQVEVLFSEITKL